MEERATGAYEVSPSTCHQAEREFPSRRNAALSALCDPLVPSRFNVSVDLEGGRVAIYNTFSTALSVLSFSAWHRFLASGSRTRIRSEVIPAPLKRLQDGGFLVPAGTDEIEMVRQYYQRARYDRTSGFAANVLLTMGCNLACQYCFQGRTQAEVKPRMMARDTEYAVTDYLTRSAAGTKSLMLSWFGGEPLLGLRKIGRMTPKLTSFCDAEGIAYRAVIATNGVLLDREAVDALVEARLSQVQVTLDIPAELKNDKQGRGTQERVLDNLDYASAKMRVQLRINLARDDEEEWDRLFSELVRRGLHKTVAQMFVAHVYEPEHGRQSGVGSIATPKTYVDAVRRQHGHAGKLGLPMSRSLASSCGSGCAATSSSAVTIDPEGLLYKCPDDAGRPERAYSSVFAEDAVNPGNLLRWLSYDWFKYEACQQCAMLPQCAGGCAHKRLFQPGQPNSSYCYWHLRGDVEGRLRMAAQDLSAAGPAPEVLAAGTS